MTDQFLMNGYNINISLLIVHLFAIFITSQQIYLASRLLNRRKVINSRYFIRLFISSLLIWLIVMTVYFIFNNLLDSVQLSSTQEIATIIIFVISIYIIKIIILPVATGQYDVWERAIWLTFTTFIFIYIVNFISTQFGQKLIIFFN